MNNTYSFLALNLETFWQQYAAHLLLLFGLALSLLMFASSKGMIHVPYFTIIADAGSTSTLPPTNAGGGGPWH